MKKLKKLRNILLATTFGLSFGIGKGYSQEKEYYIGDPNYPEKAIKIDKETFWKRAKENPHYYLIPEETVNNSVYTKWYVPIDNKDFGMGWSTPKTIQNSNTQNKSNTSKNYYVPPSNSNKNSELEDLGKAVLIGGAVIGGIYLLNELFKPRKPKYVYTEPPKVNPPANVNAEKNYISEKPWWEETKEPKKENKIWWDEDKSKSENSLEKMVKYSPETKKKLEEEVKIADEFFKEKGMNPGAQVKYKIVGTAEIVDGKLIKKDSYSPERELTDEEKVILYYTYQAMKKHPLPGPVMEGVETVNDLANPEEGAKKADKFFKEKGMNPGAQVKYKIVGTAEIVDGKLIKKDSYSPERELTNEEKIILYHAYNAFRNYTDAGQVMEGMEKINDVQKEGVKNWLNQQIKEEKEVDFLFSKPIGDNTYSYFKLAGKKEIYKNYNESSKIASYVVIKNSPWGDEIINIAKDFKEKVEKTKNFWED